MTEINKKTLRTLSLLGPSGAFGAAALELAEAEPRALMLTADLGFFAGLSRFKAAYPDRLYNFGIAEQNMLAAAAGFAKEGFIPFAVTYASFCASRCADQLRVNMSYMRLPIKLVGLCGGFGAGLLGATHMGVEDLAVMRALPNITVLSPADGLEVLKAVRAAAEHPGPVYLRLTGPVTLPTVYQEDYAFQIGKAVPLRRGSDVCIIAAGSAVSLAMQTSERLAEEGVSCSVLNMHTVKPLDREALLEADGSHLLLATMEEHNTFGGLYGAVAECLARENAHRPILPFGIQDRFVSAGAYAYQLEQSGMTVQRMQAEILSRLNEITHGR